jgi:hypothetical protein
MVGRHHDPERLLERLRGIGQNFGDAGESFVLLGVKHVKDHADEQRVAGFFPMCTTFKRAFRINQNVSDVLDVANFRGPLANLEKWIVPGAPPVGRVKQQAV